MKKAYRTEWRGAVSIVSAETRGQAVCRTLQSASGAGYKPRWPEITAHRAPEWDAWAEVDASEAAWDEKYLPKPA